MPFILLFAVLGGFLSAGLDTFGSGVLLNYSLGCFCAGVFALAGWSIFLSYEEET